jgi:AcrR family transcriptional regulator
MRLPPSDGKKRRALSRDTEARLQEAALRLFAAHGFEATGIRDIARDAGVSTAALYHYMSSKHDLLIDIMRNGLHKLTAGGQAAIEGAQTPAEALAALVRWHILYHGREQLVSLVSDNELRALSSAQLKSMIKLRDRYEVLWRDTVARGVETGDFHVQDQKLTRLALLHMCSGVVYWYSPAGELPLPAIADHFVQLALALVGYEGPLPVAPPEVTELGPSGLPPYATDGASERR